MFAAKSDIVTSSDERHRSAGIDLLRGICVLLVTLHHIHLRFKINRADVLALVPEPVGRVLFWSGYFAVITFFVISGFLITSLSLRRWTSLDRICLPEFYWLRFARIAPCLLSLVALLSVLHLAQVKGFVISAGQVSLGRAVLAALTFHVNWLEGHHGYLPGAWDVLWSLSVEEVFYLLFPVMCISDPSTASRLPTETRGMTTPTSPAWMVSRSAASPRCSRPACGCAWLPLVRSCRSASLWCH
jgi:peptidoglycan/LPS O-acetylase OafA/YrhL